MEHKHEEWPGAKPAGWFSRRNRTSEQYDAHWDRIRSDERAAAEEAETRAEEANGVKSRGPLSQILRLDKKFGVGIGAKRERAKLALRYEANQLGVYIGDVKTLLALRGRVEMARAKAEVLAVETAKTEAKREAALAPRPKG